MLLNNNHVKPTASSPPRVKQRKTPDTISMESELQQLNTQLSHLTGIMKSAARDNTVSTEQFDQYCAKYDRIQDEIQSIERQLLKATRKKRK